MEERGGSQKQVDHVAETLEFSQDEQPVRFPFAHPLLATLCLMMRNIARHFPFPACDSSEHGLKSCLAVILGGYFRG